MSANLSVPLKACLERRTAIHDATIYVIDVDAAVRDSIRAPLECEDFTVVDFASCSDFIRSARPENRCCVVLHVSMCGMNGLNLLVQMRRRYKFIPAVVISGRTGSALTRAVTRTGAAILREPFMIRELVGSIERDLIAADMRMSEIDSQKRVSFRKFRLP